MASTPSGPGVAASSPKAANPTTPNSGPTAYQPLDPARREIRLLQITGGSDASPIECRFHTASLDDEDISFTALSYVWGDESVKKDILLNGQKRAVTTNLEAALRDFWSYFKNNGDDACRRADLMSSMVENGQNVRSLKSVLASKSCELHHESDSEDDEAVYDDGKGHADEEDARKEGFEDMSLRLRLLSARQRARVGGGLPIWVDALCINQDNLKEKSHQIQLMSEIYAKASGVFAWLGSPDHQNLDLALKTIRRITPSLW
ncbi:hypothetical protein FQN54_009791 [Arachnomyces sp. PD_36]|nr:hypothetical protein FQN54_009791 [Arachnomyces sp. PD_36]